MDSRKIGKAQKQKNVEVYEFEVYNYKIKLERNR